MSWVYCAPKSRMRIRSCRAGWLISRSFDSVVRGFFNDLDVVDMRFADAGGSDLDKLGLGAQLVDRGAAGVAHAGAHAAHQLLDDADRAALVGHAAFHALGNQLVDVHLGVLEIAVRRAFLHGAERSHSAIGLVRAALEELDLAR